MLYLKSTIIYVWDVQMWNLTRNIKETDTYQAFFPEKDYIFFFPLKNTTFLHTFRSENLCMVDIAIILMFKELHSTVSTTE